MSYTYHILLQVLDSEGWKTLKIKSGAGSYSATDSRYFYNKIKNRQPDYLELEEEVEKKMDHDKYIFSYNDLEADYAKYKNKNKLYFWELLKYYTKCQDYAHFYAEVRIVFSC